MHRFCFHILIAAISCVSLSAQTSTSKSDAKKVEKPKTEISVVALGPKPTRKYKEVEGAEGPIMLMSKPGQTPPSRLYYKGKAEGDKKTAWQPFNISFNNPSSMRTIEPGKALELYRKLPDDGGYKKYVTIPAAAEGSRRVFFLIPSTIGPTPWEKEPHVRTILISSKSMEGKQFILKNLSKFTILHAFENSVVSVEPMKIISYTRPKSGELYRLAARYGTEKKIIYNTAVRLNDEGHIQLYVLYNANPRTNSGRSVGVFRTVIPARKIPELAPKP